MVTRPLRVNLAISIEINMMALSRQERDELVLDLYYNKSKTYHEIAKEARISVRDIKPILDKGVHRAAVGELRVDTAGVGPVLDQARHQLGCELAPLADDHAERVLPGAGAEQRRRDRDLVGAQRRGDGAAGRLGVGRALERRRQPAPGGSMRERLGVLARDGSYGARGGRVVQVPPHRVPRVHLGQLQLQRGERRGDPVDVAEPAGPRPPVGRPSIDSIAPSDAS